MSLQKYTQDKYKLVHKVNYLKHQDTVQQLDSAVGVVIRLRKGYELWLIYWNFNSSTPSLHPPRFITSGFRKIIPQG